MPEGNLVRMQKHALECDPVPVWFLKRLIQGEVAILVITYDRISAGCKMDANLVSPASLQFCFKQCIVTVTPHKVEYSVRRLPVRLDANAPLPIRCRVFKQWQFDMLPRVLPFPMHKSKVAFVQFTFANLFMEAGQGGALLGQEQHTGSFAVQAMHKFQEFGLRPGCPQLLDHAITDAGSAMHRHPCRLVDYEEMRVFQQNPEFGTGNGLICLFSNAYRRDADDIPLLEAVSLVDPSFVDPHLAGPQYAVDMAFRYAFTDAQKEIIDALIRFVFGNSDHPDLSGYRGGLFN